jgi:hypothetical protein
MKTFTEYIYSPEDEQRYAVIKPEKELQFIATLRLFQYYPIEIGSHEWTLSNNETIGIVAYKIEKPKEERHAEDYDLPDPMIVFKHWAWLKFYYPKEWSAITNKLGG